MPGLILRGSKLLATMATPNSTLLFDHGIGAFTAAELDSIEQYCDSLALIKAPLGGRTEGDPYEHIRISRVAAIRQDPQIMWLYERIASVVRTLNRTYQFDLRGFHEALQYTVYHDREGGHFDWHIDQGPQPPRKLSLTLQLTDPSRYEGGDLQFNTGTKPVTAPKDRGVAIAFPSFVLHRVTPVTAGTRKALVAWVTGPSFK